MATLPFALVGGIWLLWLLGHNLSVASAVGFIALAGRGGRVRRDHAALPEAGLGRAQLRAGPPTARDLLDAIREGAVLRVRPKAMTVAVILAGLLPIMWGGGTGSGGHAAHRRADGRRHDHRAAAVDVRDPGGVSADAAAQGLVSRHVLY